MTTLIYQSLEKLAKEEERNKWKTNKNLLILSYESKMKKFLKNYQREKGNKLCLQ